MGSRGGSCDFSRRDRQIHPLSKIQPGPVKEDPDSDRLFIQDFCHLFYRHVLAIMQPQGLVLPLSQLAGQMPDILRFLLLNDDFLWIWRRGGRIDRSRSFFLRPEAADGLPDGNRVQPCRKFELRVESVDVSEGFEKGFLDQVFDILVCFETVSQKIKQTGAVSGDEFLKRRAGASSHLRCQLFIGEVLDR